MVLLRGVGMRLAEPGVLGLHIGVEGGENGVVAREEVGVGRRGVARVSRFTSESRRTALCSTRSQRAGSMLA